MDKSQEQELIRSALEGKLRNLVLELWQQTRVDWGFATDRLAQVFRRERQLSSAERRFVAELLYAMIRHVRRADTLLGQAGLKKSGRAPDKQRLIAVLVLEHGLSPDDAQRHEPGVDWSRLHELDQALGAERKAVERIALRHSMPDFLAKALVADWGDEADALAAALNERAPMSIRANTLKNDRQELQKRLADEGIETTPGQYADNCLRVDTRTNLFGLKAFQEGRFEAQDEGSQLIAELVAPPPKGVVVDYCAGAGGKTLSLSAALDNRGRILASDISKRKLKELRRRAKRAGAGNIQVVNLPVEDAAAFPKPFENILGKAARVLVDAPCTGVGSLRRNPESRWRLTVDELDRLPQVQLQIARRALELVAPGGRLIYATCTILKKENEDIIDALMSERDDLEIISPREVWGATKGDPVVDATGRFLLTAPHRHQSDGFFAAVLRRKPG